MDSSIPLEIMDDHPILNERFDYDRIEREQWDALLAEGWRHCNIRFFRHSLDFNPAGDTLKVLPLRIRLDGFKLTKSQRKVMRKNSDLRCFVRSVVLDETKYALFEQHKQRFSFHVPPSLHVFISEQTPHQTPCDGYEIDVFKDDRLIACSFFDVGYVSSSGTYAMFDLNESERSLGVFTMIIEILYAVKTGKRFYYPGYAHAQSSFYDYKKKFNNLEAFDWKGNWKAFIVNSEE